MSTSLRNTPTTAEAPSTVPVLSLRSLPALRIPRRTVKWLMWTVIPGVVIVGVMHDALSGEEGLMERHLVKQRVIAVQAEVAEVEARNTELRSQVEALRSDRSAVVRAAAEELLLAPEGSTVYRFE